MLGSRIFHTGQSERRMTREQCDPTIASRPSETARSALPPDRPATPERFIWLFDQRFDLLCRAFREHLQHLGARDPEPVLGSDVFPAVAKATATSPVAELRQHSPEQVNQMFLAAWDRDDPRVAGPSSIPIVSFTMEGLAKRPGFSLYGPSPQLAEQLNDKACQLRWLQQAGLPVPPFDVVNGPNELSRCLDELLTTHGTIFVQPTHSAGGEFAALLQSPDDLVPYRERLLAAGHAPGASNLLATQFFPGATSLSGHALVTRQGHVLPLAVNELLLDGFRFDGFIFPVFETPAVEEQLLDLTIQAGELLARRGYWGYLAVDFLYRQDALLLINEINVRFAGEAAFLAADAPLNLFCLLNDETPPAQRPLIPRPASRVVVTKIRPLPGRTYTPPAPKSSVGAFLTGADDDFRVHFHNQPVHVLAGHFLGLAGRRFDLSEERQSLYAFYQQARQAEAA
jgi:ATP-grasp domain